MVTVGRGILQDEAYGFFDALRSYDAATASKFLHEHATFTSPWSGGKVVGKEAVEEHLAKWLGDPQTRPSITSTDVTGGPARVCIHVSVSGRFGRAPRPMQLWLLTLQDKVHQVVLQDA